MTVIELVPLSQLEPESAQRRMRRWEPWHLDPDLRTLWTNAGGYLYEIDLDQCTTSAEVLDWIMQLHGKQWGVDVVSGLVAAFRDILHPQANLCSFGRSETLTEEQVAELVARWDV